MIASKYDDPAFFQQYAGMRRSTEGLQGAGEWHALRKLLPDFSGKRVLDLGCGYGWHCAYAVEHGAAFVAGVDLSARMLQEAQRRNPSPKIQYLHAAIEEYCYPPEEFDIVISSLALHYATGYQKICRSIHRTLVPGGTLVFSVEHPIFTACGSQDWCYDEAGNILHWPVDRYFTEGKRQTVFLGHAVEKQHRTLTTYLEGLLQCGFQITHVVEPEPDPQMLQIPGMQDELRRPMMLLVAAVKA